MQLEGAKAELRSRPHYEAADLGIQLLRALFRPALSAWLGIVLPLQLCVVLLCWRWTPLFSYLALWWLKPVYDRAWGLTLGRGLFGDVPDTRALYRALWSDGRRGLLGDLSWRRLDPARTLVASVALLEGLSGAPAARRRRALSAGSTGIVGLLCAACFAIELGALAGIALAAQQLIPEKLSWMAEELWQGGSDLTTERALIGAYLLAIAWVEPLFVASGFGLYINRRTDIEGWDVELTFRRMARRLARDVGAALVLLLSLSLTPMLTATVAAQQQAPVTRSAVDEARRLPAPTLENAAQAERAMARVLARPELARVHVEEHWELRSKAGSSADAPAATVPWLSALATLLARGLSALLWIAALLALGVVAYLIIERSQNLRSDRATRELAPELSAVLRGPDAPAYMLAPGEVVAQARALLARGQHAAALSVLYVGTLGALMQQDGLHLPPQATEGQCLAAVRAAEVSEERRALFAELTALWQLSAYAHAQPHEARLTEMCARFSVCFGASA